MKKSNNSDVYTDISFSIYIGRRWPTYAITNKAFMTCQSASSYRTREIREALEKEVEGS